MTISLFDLKKELNIEQLIDLLFNMVSIESHNKIPTYEENISHYIYDYLISQGINATLQRVAEHRYNVIATIEGEDNTKNLLFTGHIDTVEDYGYPNLFTPYIKDNKIYGRGTSDMKGPIASMIMAAILLKKLNIKPKMNLTLAFVVDEEFTSIGTEALIENGLKANVAILGEPTNMNISIGHRGLEWIIIEVYGVGTHGGTSSKGVNAITKAAKLVSEIDDKIANRLKNVNDPILGNPAMNFGVFNAGYQPSTVPDKCTIKIDRRWVFGETIEDIYKEYQLIIDELSQKDKEFTAKLFRDYQNMNKMEHRPVAIDKEDSIVKELFKTIELVTNSCAETNTFSGWTDASLLGNYGNIPTVIFGPGDISTAHSEKEYIEIDQLYNATLIYSMIAINYGRD